jgi:DNA-binding XRE family transcriptional regulator
MMAETVEKVEMSHMIQEARIEAGIPTSAEAARRVGMAQTNYWRLENESRQPSWRLIHRVIVGLGLHLERFFPDHMILEAAHRIVGRKSPAQ